MELIAGLDLGTSSAKLTVVTPDGEVVARRERAYPTHTAPGGVAEQDPEHWWEAARAVLLDSGVAGRVAALGLTGHMQNVIPVDDAARATRPAILYSDTRAEAETARLRGVVTDWETRTGNHQDATNVPAKLAWLAEHEPDALARASHVLLGPAGYVAFRATGHAACDPTTASTAGVLDMTTRGWLADAIEAAGGRVEQFPRLTGERVGDALVGEVGASAAGELGLRPGTPVVHGLGDAGSTTDGLVGVEPGDAYLYLGTTGWLAAITPTGHEPGPIHALMLPGWEHLLRIGSVQSAGSTSAWARAQFFPGLSFTEVEGQVAGRVDDLTNRPLALPGLAGERTPVRDGALRGAFVGVQEGTDAADLYLAALTGVAMGLRHAADAMGVAQRRIALVGGAASSPAWRRILADVFGATIVTGEAVEPAAHSAARSAADAVGIPHSLLPLLGARRELSETQPSPVHEAYQRQLPIHRGLYDALTDTFHALGR
ncbi:xylulokinase [Tessaracoccus massiliensis]|uniref:xylulokinase n=1 Tax=Tessaracoccus massiliensis TaxID=1522311 RepID=UPI0006948DCC|nr:FGGY family carbohydrate kinase [Tessaracoccus massiliensis]